MFIRDRIESFVSASSLRLAAAQLWSRIDKDESTYMNAFQLC